MKKVLITATSDGHLHIFHIPYLKWLKEHGCEVHIAVEQRRGSPVPFTDKSYLISFPRSPFSFKMFSTYRQLKKIMKDNQYDIIHCHTPIPGILTRIAAKTFRKKGAKVIYTAHGLHFFKGSSKLSWLTYFPAEKYVSNFTDDIITINEEDYLTVKNHFKNKRTWQIKGIGVDNLRFFPAEINVRNEYRSNMGYSTQDVLVICTGELNANKNQQFIITTLALIIEKMPNLHLLIAGKGPEKNNLEQLVLNLGIKNNVHFLGFRTDLEKIVPMADIAVSASKREGFGIALAEAMSCSLPVIASRNRGHKEIIDHGVNGFFFDLDNPESLIFALNQLYFNKELRNSFSINALEKSKYFSINSSLRPFTTIYTEYLK